MGESPWKFESSRPHHFSLPAPKLKALACGRGGCASDIGAEDLPRGLGAAHGRGTGRPPAGHIAVRRAQAGAPEGFGIGGDIRPAPSTCFTWLRRSSPSFLGSVGPARQRSTRVLYSPRKAASRAGSPGGCRLPPSAANPLRRRGAPQSALAVAETGTSSDNRVPSGPLSMVSSPPRLRARVSMLVSPRPRR